MKTGTTASPPRLDRIDALRGAAMIWMALFHLCFDLNFYGLFSPRQSFFHDPFWTQQRTVILSLFLFCAGLGQAVALERGQGWRSFWRRWLLVAGCAVLVSVGSATMFPQSWIRFGVLHGIAVMLILARLAAGMRWWLWPLGLLAVLMPQLFVHPAFNGPWLSWVGLVTRKPITEDWVPLLPWLGVMLWGLAAGQTLMQRRTGVLSGALPAALRPLSTLGRWSLSFYMVHQPVFIGALMLGRSQGWW